MIVYFCICVYYFNGLFIRCFPPCLEFIPAFLACLCSGVVAIPVYPPDPTRAKFDCGRFHAICESASVSHVLTNTLYYRVSKFLPTLARDSRWSRLSWWDSRIVINEPGLLGSVFDYPFPRLSPEGVAFLQYTSGSTGQPKGVMVSIGGLLHNSHLCCGSFGFPCCMDDVNQKGSIDDIPFEEYGTWFNDFRQVLHKKFTGHDIRTLSWLPVYHDMGLIGFVCVPFLFGGCSYQMSPIDFIKKPWLWMHCLSKYEALCTAGPNFAFELSVRKMPDEIFKQLDLSKVCGILCGAEPIRRRTVTRFFEKFGVCGLHDWAFRPAYGLAENTLIVSGPQFYDSPVNFACVDATILRIEGRAVGRTDELLTLKSVMIEDENWTTLVSCGRPKPSVDVRIVDPETRTETHPTYVGEIWLRSPSLALGYFGCAEESRKAFGNTSFVGSRDAFTAESANMSSESGYFRTGDAGFILHGELFVVGRIKDMLIIRGKNYFPQDVETEVESIPEIREGCCAAFSLEVDGEERLGLAIEVRDNALKSGMSARLTGMLGLGKQYDEGTLARLGKEVKAKVSETLGLELTALWICRPKSLPKTSSGKLRRSIIRDMLLSSESSNPNVLVAPIELKAGASLLQKRSLPAALAPKPARIQTPETIQMGDESQLLYSPSAKSLFPHPAGDLPVERNSTPEPPTAVRKVPPNQPVKETETLASRRAFVRSVVLDAAKESIKIDQFDEDVFEQPLFELGVDSIGAISFVEGLASRLDRKLETTILFEFPTLRSLEDYLVADPDSPAQGLENSLSAPLSVSSNAPLFIFGVACRFPGASRLTALGPHPTLPGVHSSSSLGVEDFWNNLYKGFDAMTEVPLDRWNVDAYWTAVTEPLTAGKIYTRGGGFIEDAEYFDSQAFRLAPREVEQMDPQQRLALEVK